MLIHCPGQRGLDALLGMQHRCFTLIDNSKKQHTHTGICEKRGVLEMLVRGFTEPNAINVEIWVIRLKNHPTEKPCTLSDECRNYLQLTKPRI